MAKTIQVRENTYRLLERLKRRMSAKSFNEVIERLAMRELELSDDMFGVDRGRLPPFRPEDRVEDRW